MSQIYVPSTSSVSNPVTPAQGGTGVSNPTAHAVAVGEGSSNFNFVGPGAANTVLAGTGVTTDPAFTGTPTVTTMTATGTFQAANGSAGAPSHTFTNNTQNGMWLNGTSLSFSNSAIGGEILRLQSVIECLGTLVMDSQMAISYVAPAAGSFPYNATGNDNFISVTTAGGARTVRLPNAPRTGIVFVVKDRTGNAGANNISVTTVGGVVTIDGSTTYPINTNFGHFQFIFNGTSYEVY